MRPSAPWRILDLGRWCDARKIASAVIPSRAFWARNLHSQGGGSWALLGVRRGQMTTCQRPSHRHFAMQNRSTECEALGGIDDGVGIDAVMAIELVDGAG